MIVNLSKALKVYARTWSDENFKKERLLHGMIGTHENIVRLLDSYINVRAIEERYMLIELCEVSGFFEGKTLYPSVINLFNHFKGGSLDQILREFKDANMPIEVGLRNKWLRELITAISHLHSKGLVHNDIHPL